MLPRVGAASPARAGAGRHAVVRTYGMNTDFEVR